MCPGALCFLNLGSGSKLLGVGVSASFFSSGGLIKISGILPDYNISRDLSLFSFDIKEGKALLRNHQITRCPKVKGRFEFITAEGG